MTLAYLLAGVVMIALTAYALLGGADFGGGVWDLLAFGPRKDRQRELIAHAIGPVWEANHVWLILAVVLLFTCFPLAFTAMAMDLHIPLTLALIGIVLRGSAFSFRAYGDSRAAGVRRWGRVFSIASLITPLLLGICVGAVTSSAPWDAAGPGTFRSMFVSTWLNWYCVSVGVLALAAFAFLAAVYLTVEATDAELREDFRLRGVWAGIAVGVAALLVLLLAGTAARSMREGLLHSTWSVPLHLAALGVAVTAVYALWVRRWRLARIAAAFEVAFLLWGWGLGQFPYLLPPNLTIEDAAAPQATLEGVTIALVVGGAVLIPSLIYLFRVFKSANRTIESP
ncbi:MAG TPA: cytochrome d ubiquinol oxidase subunit II [Gemmatimonadales bacterium]|nr:cytochrome d ubiquinol oxidase subunit II [Gemmatimonadales bacterium]